MTPTDHPEPYTVGTRVRVPCFPPHPDLSGTVREVYRQPWGFAYRVEFDTDFPVVTRMGTLTVRHQFITVGACMFREQS